MDDAYSNRPTSPRDRKSTIESLRNENMNYIDSSDVIVEYYKNQTASGLDRYFLEIEDWLSQEKQTHENAPLVLEADDGIGKKTLLVKWMEYHAKNKKGRYPDFIIPHFATQQGKNSNYFYAIYRILIKLREALNVKQKVELLEEKLRRYFHYWLEICNRQLEQQIVNGAKIIYDKVILIFEGIDNFRDMLDVHREANVSFWLPKYFPKNIKVIVTAERVSNSMRILKPYCQIIPIVCDLGIIKQMVNNHLNKQLKVLFTNLETEAKVKDIFIKLNQKVRNQPLFVRSFFSVFLPYPTEGIVNLSEVDKGVVDQFIEHLTYDQLKNLRSVEDLFEFQLHYFSQKFIFTQKEGEMKYDPKFIQVMTVLAITQKGLTYKEIQQVVQFDDKQWKLFLVFFKVFLMKHRDLWIIHNEIFKKVVINCYHNSDTRYLHNEIADTIGKYTNNSIRKLEEETFHLFQAKDFFKLKEVISIIENFLLLFNPNNKYDLCRYWQNLEENGFDPVLEYNKAIEGFQIHYHPTPEDLFRIIIQVSRFLKEFGDFETKNTPIFRHPPIIGTLQDLYDIGLIQEILKLDLYYNKDPEYKHFDPNKHLNRVSKPIKAEILSRMESLNVEIAQNREEVRNYYLKQMIKQNEYSENEEIKEPQEINVQQFKEFIHRQLKKLLEQQKETLSRSLFDEFMERESTDYYYKRWIWIQFPWACLSISKYCDYSTIIKHCFSSATDYMTVEEEHAYTNSALKIAIEAKLKKKQMYESNNNDNDPLLMIPQKSVLMIQPIEKEGLLDPSESHRYERQQVQSISLPKLTTIESTNNKSLNQYKRTMFITQDFTDFDTLNKESKDLSIRPTQVKDGQMTLKQLEKQKEQKTRLKQYQATSLSLSSYQQTTIFPILKDDIANHSIKQLDIIQNQSKQMRKRLDSLVYENAKLAKTLKQQKIIDFNKGYIKKELSNLEELKKKQEQLKLQIDNAYHEYGNSTRQIKRVRTITKICKDNKQQNEEYIRYLALLINNFKKLIKFEHQDNSKFKQQIKVLYRTIDEFLNTYIQRRDHQKQLLNQIRVSLENKRNLDMFFNNSDNFIQEQAMNSIQGLRRNQAKMNTVQQFKLEQQQKEENNKQIIQRLEEFEVQYAKIKDIFDVRDQTYSKQAKFIDFMANIEKKSQLNITLSEQRQKLDEVLIKRERLQEQLKTFQNAYPLVSQPSLQEQQQDQSQDHTERQDYNSLQLQVDTLKKLQNIRVKCHSSYESFLIKLNCQDQQQLTEYMKQRKQMIIDQKSQDDYNKIIKNKYQNELNEVYKKAFKFQQNIKQEEDEEDQ